jgi:hypothetical protein
VSAITLARKQPKRKANTMGDKYIDLYFYLFYMWFLNFTNNMKSRRGDYDPFLYDAALKINDEHFYLVCTGCFIKGGEDMDDVSVRKRVQNKLNKRFMTHGIVKLGDDTLRLTMLNEDDQSIPMIYKFLGMRSVTIIPRDKGIGIQFNGNPQMMVYITNDPVNPKIICTPHVNDSKHMFNEESFKREFSTAIQMKKDL